MKAWVEQQYTQGAPGTPRMALPANMSGYGLVLEEIRNDDYGQGGSGGELQVPQVGQVNTNFEK